MLEIGFNCGRVVDQLQWHGNVDPIDETAGVLNAVQNDTGALDFESIKVVPGRGNFRSPVLGEKIVKPPDKSHPPVPLKDFDQTSTQLGVGGFLQSKQLGCCRRQLHEPFNAEAS
jgi:hypothetical protein